MPNTSKFPSDTRMQLWKKKIVGIFDQKGKKSANDVVSYNLGIFLCIYVYKSNIVALLNWKFKILNQSASKSLTHLFYQSEEESRIKKLLLNWEKLALKFIFIISFIVMIVCCIINCLLKFIKNLYRSCAVCFKLCAASCCSCCLEGDASK